MLHWFRSFVSESSECVLLGKIKTEALLVKQGVTQGSVLGARLYTLYVRPLSDIFNRHDVHYHSYADDTQLYVHFERSCADSMREAQLKLESCIKEISHWMSHNGLKLNEDKTEWIIFNGCDISENVTLTRRCT